MADLNTAREADIATPGMAAVLCSYRRPRLQRGLTFQQHRRQVEGGGVV